MKRGQFGTRTIWHRSEKGTIWHRDVIRIRNAISRLERNTLSNGREILCQIFGNPHFKSTPGREKTSSFALFKQWQNIFPNPPTVIYPPNVGRMYPIQIYLSYWHMFPNPALEGRTDTLQLSCIPPIVGRIYPIQIYLFNWHICKIFVCLLRKMIVLNCPFYTAVPNCPWCQIVPFSLRCQIVLGAKLS